MTTPILPFHHPSRRTSRLDDAHAVKAELQRLYDYARTDPDGKNHSYVQVMVGLLKFAADLCKRTDYDERLAKIEDELAGVPQTRPNGFKHLGIGERRQ
jgi:hypothetical protein